jgi:hypothetical protein
MSKETYDLLWIPYYLLLLIRNRKYDSPFAQRAKQSYGRRVYIGGKSDDITVVVGEVHLVSQGNGSKQEL